MPRLPTNATITHECHDYPRMPRCHCFVNSIQDCSRGGTYHNSRFRDSAEKHGLIVDHHDKYGWTITRPSDRLLQFCLDNDLGDILINRNEYGGYRVTGTGTHFPAPPPVISKTSSTRKYICPCCGNSVRATNFPVTERAVQKQLHIVCDYLGYDGISTHSFRKWYATEIYKNSGYP